MGLNNTLRGLEKFFQGCTATSYWIGYSQGVPFAFLITAPAEGDAITLDLFICDLNYLGKGLAVPMMHAFLVGHFPHVKRVLIDPEATNARAIHVYQKAGFKIEGEFIASWHPVPHYQMNLDNIGADAAVHHRFLCPQHRAVRGQRRDRRSRWCAVRLRACEWKP